MQFLSSIPSQKVKTLAKSHTQTSCHQCDSHCCMVQTWEPREIDKFNKILNAPPYDTHSTHLC